VEILRFEAGDADAAATLVRPLQPGVVVTPATLIHRETSGPERARRRSWVAVEDGDAVGFATSALKWEGPSGIARFWVGVKPDSRRRGLGAALYERAERHVRKQGARKLTVEVDDDPAGLQFVEHRGFRRAGVEVVSTVDPRAADLAELEPLLAKAAAAGYELATLGTVGERRDELALFYDAAGAWSPGEDEANLVTPEDLWSVVFESPDLTWKGSFVVLDRSRRIVSLASLTVDAARGRAEHDWTATLPELRGRRLALLAKLATIRWARDNGIRQLVTSNAAKNIPMLTLNERLGYKQRYERVELEREL
jgi:GNAT superfamily N-acetyltransferase